MSRIVAKQLLPFLQDIPKLNWERQAHNNFRCGYAFKDLEETFEVSVWQSGALYVNGELVVDDLREITALFASLDHVHKTAASRLLTKLKAVSNA